MVAPSRQLLRPNRRVLGGLGALSANGGGGARSSRTHRPLLFEVSRRRPQIEAVLEENRRNRRAALMAFALGFLAFMPYPAISVGNRSALAMGNLVTFVACFGALTLSWWRTRGALVYPLIILGMGISALRVTLGAEGDGDLSLKVVIMWTTSCLTIVAAQIYFPRAPLALMSGIAAMTVIHVGVGLWQFVAFQSGEFPLLGLYVNPSFLDVQENAVMYARWMRRPFGLFPEPSAMASSLAPWVLLWAAYFAGLVRFKREPATWQRALFATAAAGALALIIVSRSGHAAITLAAAIVFAGIWFVRSRATPRALLAVLGGAGIVLPLVLWAGAAALSDRVGESLPTMNSSWEERSSSLVTGLRLMTESSVGAALFGLGPGMAPVRIYEAVKIQAVFSVLLTYLYETGLVGFLILFWIGHQIVSVWKSLRFDVVFAVVAAVWLVGITVTTSYEQLLPIWLTLGWLTVWPSVCEPVLVRAKRVVPAARRVKAKAQRPPQSDPREHRSPWRPALAAPVGGGA